MNINMKADEKILTDGIKEAIMALRKEPPTQRSAIWYTRKLGIVRLPRDADAKAHFEQHFPHSEIIAYSDHQTDDDTRLWKIADLRFDEIGDENYVPEYRIGENGELIKLPSMQPDMEKTSNE